MKLQDMSVGKKLGLGFAGVVAVIGATSGTAIYNLAALSELDSRKIGAVEVLDAMQDGQFRLARQENSVRGWLISRNEYYLERIESHRESFKAALGEARALLADEPAQLETLAKIEADADAWYDGVVPLVTTLARDPATYDQAAALVSPDGLADQLIAPAEDGVQAIIDSENAKIEILAADVAKAQALTRAVMAGGMIAALMLAIVIGFALARMIATPTIAMAQAMRRLAEGDNDLEIPAIGRKDEIGAMADAVQVFKFAAIERASLELEAEESRRQATEQRERAEAERERARAEEDERRNRAEAERLRNDEERERARAAMDEQRRLADEARARTEAERVRHEAEARQAQEMQARVVSVLDGALAAMSGGDLTCRIDQPFSPEYEGLRANYNAALGALQDAVSTMVHGVEAIRGGAEEISRASDDLSRRTEQQAASLEETAAALDEITETVSKGAQGAQDAAKMVGSTRQDAERGGQVVKRAVEAMSEIEASAQQITQIIGVIDEIAFQTNLLALNAGVEAARAGDAGRGFAVVASEVRALAQRSADAAKEIKTLISKSSEQVGAGVALVGETGQALERIVGRVVDIDALVNAIALSVQEQSAGLAQVNIAINQMDQSTQQNAAMVEESTAATRSLTEEAQSLARAASRFRVDSASRSSSQNASPQRAPARAARSEPRPAPRSEPRSDPRPAPRAAPQGRAAALLAERPDSDEWKEF